MAKILIIDLETSGFDKRHDSIVEVGIVELDLETGDAKIIYDKIVREHKNINCNAWIFKNSDLKYEQVLAADLINLEEIQDIIDRYKGITAYNNAFDFSWLESRDILLSNKLECPMLASTGILKIPKGKGYKWPNVEEAYSFFCPNVDYVEKHRGADDALHEAAIVYALHTKYGFYNVGT